MVQGLETGFAAYKAPAASPVDEAFSTLVHFGTRKQPAGLTYQARVQMVGVARHVSIEEATSAIQWYAAQQPAARRGRQSKPMEGGRSIYTQGLQSRGINACQSCHGTEAQGSGTVPRLAGQNALYVAGQLALFRTGERRNSPMTEISRRLESDQVRSLAAYLQSR